MGLCLAPANASVLGTPMGCPSIPFNSVLTLPAIAQASSLRALSHKTVPHVRCHPKSWLPVGPTGFEFRCPLFCSEASQVAQGVKNLPANAGDSGSIPGSERSPGEGHGHPLQYSCLGNPMDRGAGWATVHGVTKSQTRLSD